LLKRDYHTALDVRKASGTKMTDTKSAEVSERYYLADAAFLVGLEGDDLELLHKLDRTLRNPHWFLFLGRKAFVPSEPVWVEDGICKGVTLEDALSNRHPRLRPKRQEEDERMRLVIEVKVGERGEITRRDQPVSFVQDNRQFDARNLRIGFCDEPTRAKDKEAS